MRARVNRREALRQFGAAGVGMTVAPVVLRGQAGPMTVAGKPVEIIVSSISSSTVRADVAAPGGAKCTTTARSSRRRRAPALARRRKPFGADQGGRPDGAIHVTSAPVTDGATRRSERTVVQQIVLDADTPRVSFSLGKGPLLGFGEGGPQFDRKGAVYTKRNGQGGYQLRTHGGRVPIQWLVSTDGWGLFVHHPLGAFDLTGASGILTPAAETQALPLDLFVPSPPIRRR